MKILAQGGLLRSGYLTMGAKRYRPDVVEIGFACRGSRRPRKTPGNNFMCRYALRNGCLEGLPRVQDLVRGF